MVGANKHPQAMGRPAFEVLAEIRGIIEPLLRHVSRTGEATWSEDLMLPLVRGAAPEESYFTFTYSPIRRRIGRRRGRLLRRHGDDREGDRGAAAAAPQRPGRGDAGADEGGGVRARGGADRALPERRPVRAPVSARRERVASPGWSASRTSSRARRSRPRRFAFGDRSVWPFDESADARRAAVRRARRRRRGRARRR